MIRASFIAPCVGVGGADMLMMELIKYTETIDWTGVAIPAVMPQGWVEFCNKYWPRKARIHTLHRQHDPRPLPDYMVAHSSHRDCILAATKDSDLAIAWCINDLPPDVNVPIIEYCQNTDKHAKWIVESNQEHITYKAACSKAAAQCFEDPSDVTVIYNGINPARVTPRQGRDEQRKTWSIGPDKKVILFMGRFVKEKQPQMAIEVLKYLPNDYATILCGEGALQPELYSFARFAAPGRVAFVEKQYHVGDLLDVCDCFLLPSQYEGHPLAMMEAMLAGKHCVYSEMPVMQELEAMFGPLGEMLPMDATAEQYASAILEATKESNELHYKRGNARAVVWSNFTISKIASDWEQYLEACLLDTNRRKRLSVIYPVTGGKIKKGKK